MSKLKNLLGFLIVVVIVLFILWGGTELISNIFDIEDSGAKKGVRWSLLIAILILGALARRKAK